MEPKVSKIRCKKQGREKDEKTTSAHYFCWIIPGATLHKNSRNKTMRKSMPKDQNFDEFTMQK